MTGNSFRSLAITSLIIGAIGSLAFMFYTGRNNDSVVLMTLFTGWVIMPFIGLDVVAAKATRSVVFILVFVLS